jgi:Concanavalin A-like lectin/glucanases superfamily
MGLRYRRRGGGYALVAACLALLVVPGIASGAAVSVWHMDETSGSTMHDGVGSNSGTLKNVSLGQPGVSGLAYGFDGASSVVTVPSDSSLNPGSSPFWMIAHVKFTGVPTAAIGGDYDLIRKGLSSTSGGFYKMELLPSGSGVRAHCSMKGSATSRSLTSGPDLADGRWHTVECVKDDSSISVVVDGVKASAAVVLGSFSNAASLAIGAKAEGGDWYEGVMDEASFGTGTPVDAIAPANTALPAISGTPVEGSPLGATAGTWEGTGPISYAYQWQRCNAAGAQCAGLPGATASSYTPVAGDRGSTLRVTVTATNSGGGRAATSLPSGVVAAASGPGGAVTVGVVRESDTQACTRLSPRAVLRRARLHGRAMVTLRFDARTRAVRLRAPRGEVRSVTVTLDGRRMRSARGGSLQTILRRASLGRGTHVLKAIVHPRHGKARTLRVRLTSTSC